MAANAGTAGQTAKPLLKGQTVKATVKAPVKRSAKKHWTDEFFKHVDALGEELRKARRTAKA